MSKQAMSLTTAQTWLNKIISSYISRMHRADMSLKPTKSTQMLNKIIIGVLSMLKHMRLHA